MVFRSFARVIPDWSDMESKKEANWPPARRLEGQFHLLDVDFAPQDQGSGGAFRFHQEKFSDSKTGRRRRNNPPDSVR
jgi:hypothetical protein